MKNKHAKYVDGEITGTEKTKWRPMGCRPDGWKPSKVEYTSEGEIKAKKIKPQGKIHPELKANVVVDKGPRAQLLVWDAVCKAYRNKKNGKFVQYGDSKKRNRKSLTKRQIAEIDSKARKLNKEFSDAQYVKNNMTVQETFNTYINYFARDFAHRSILNLSRAYDQRYSTEKFEDVLKIWKDRLVKVVTNEIQSAIDKAATFKSVHNETYKFGENFGVEKVVSLSTFGLNGPLANQVNATEQIMTYDEILNYEKQRRENDIAQFEEELVKNLKAVFDNPEEVNISKYVSCLEDKDFSVRLRNKINDELNSKLSRKNTRKGNKNG